MRRGKEESLVINTLKMFSTLEREQVLTMLVKGCQKVPETAERILNGLIKRREIFENTPYLSLLPTARPNSKVLTAFWVLLHYIGQIRLDAFYPIRYPAQILFIKDNKEYEIMVYEPGDSHIVSVAEHVEQGCDDDIPTYLIVTTSENQLESIPKINFKAYIVLCNRQDLQFFEVDHDAEERET